MNYKIRDALLRSILFCCLSIIMPLKLFAADMTISDIFTTNGDWTVTGVMSATSFSGNGAALSYVTATGLSCTGCVTLDHLNFSPLTSADFSGNGSATTAARSDHNHDGIYQKKYAKVAVVAISGGDYADPISAMNDLSTWCGTPGALNRCLLKIMPGYYDLGSNSLQMVQGVDVEGSGKYATIIKGSNGSYSGVIITHSTNVMTEIRSLTVENDGTPGTGGTVALSISGTTKVSNIAATAVGGEETYAIRCVCSGTCGTQIFSGVTASGKDGTSANYGVYDNCGIKMTEVSATGESGVGTADNYGIEGASQELNTVTAIGSGGRYTVGLSVDSSCPLITNSNIKGYLGTDNYGVYITSSCGYQTKIVNSILSGATNSIVNPASSTTYIATSSIDGPIDNAGTIKCVGSFSGAFDPLGSNCL